ncbi:universal stress protein [Pseudomonadota bacterium]
MYSKIMIPIDLAHADKLEKAINVAVALAKTHNAELSMIGVTGEEPSVAAHNPHEYEEHLAEYVAGQSRIHGIAIKPVPRVSVDVRIDLPALLEEEAEKDGYDLIVMASHTPGMMDHIFTSNAGHVASYSKASVFVVRG